MMDLEEEPNLSNLYPYPMKILVILDHKTSLKCQFFLIEIYKSYESWINKLSIYVPVAQC